MAGCSTVAASGPVLTAVEWGALAEETPGELVDGYLVEEEVPDPIHGLTVSWLIALFRAWLPREAGFVFDSDVKLAISSNRGRKPDVSVYLPGRKPPPRRGLLHEPPDIVIEVVSASPRDERRDRVEKMEDYAVCGVRYYWIVDPALGSVEIFELNQEGHYAKVTGITGGRISPAACAGLVVDVDALWAELSRLAGD